MPKLIPCDGDKIVLISPDGIEYPGTIERKGLTPCNTYRIESTLGSGLPPNWRMRLEEEDRTFISFPVFLTTDRS